MNPNRSNRIELKWTPSLGNIRHILISVQAEPLTWPHLILHGHEGGTAGQAGAGVLLANDVDILEDVGEEKPGSTHQRGYMIKSPTLKAHEVDQGFVGIIPRRTDGAEAGDNLEHPKSYWRNLKFFPRFNPSWKCKCSFPDVTKLNWYGGFNARNESSGTSQTQESSAGSIGGETTTHYAKAHFFYTSNDSGFMNSQNITLGDIHNKLCFVYTKKNGTQIERYFSRLDNFVLESNVVYEFDINIVNNKIMPSITLSNGKRILFHLGVVEHDEDLTSIGGTNGAQVASGNNLNYTPIVDDDEDYLPFVGMYTTADNDPSRMDLIELNYSRSSHDNTIIENGF